MLGRCCGTDSAGREEGQALSKTHHSMVNDTLLSFCHTILPFPPSFNPSQIKRGVIHSSQLPGGQENATTPSRVRLTACVWVYVVPLNCCPGTDFSTKSSPLLCFLSRSLFVWCQSRGLCWAQVVFLSPVADLLPLRYCGVRAEKCLSVPVTKICQTFFLHLLRCLLIVTHWLYKVQDCRWRHLKRSPRMCDFVCNWI